MAEKNKKTEVEKALGAVEAPKPEAPVDAPKHDDASIPGLKVGTGRAARKMEYEISLASDEDMIAVRCTIPGSDVPMSQIARFGNDNGSNVLMNLAIKKDGQLLAVTNVRYQVGAGGVSGPFWNQDEGRGQFARGWNEAIRVLRAAASGNPKYAEAFDNLMKYGGKGGGPIIVYEQTSGRRQIVWAPWVPDVHEFLRAHDGKLKAEAANHEFLQTKAQKAKATK
jgi:hypothetical protein